MRRVNKGIRRKVKLQCPRCLNGLLFTQALMLTRQAIEETTVTAAPTGTGARVHQLESNLFGLDELIEEAYLDWRKWKTADKRSVYERLLEERVAMRTELKEQTGKSTEVLAAIEKRAVDRAKDPLDVLRAIAVSMSFNTLCNELTLSTLSGKLVSARLDLNLSDAF